jgi:hypothetical protein
MASKARKDTCGAFTRLARKIRPPAQFHRVAMKANQPANRNKARDGGDRQTQ